MVSDLLLHAALEAPVLLEASTPEQDYVSSRRVASQRRRLRHDVFCSYGHHSGIWRAFPPDQAL